MISHSAVPFLLLAVILLPLPFFFYRLLFTVLLAVRPRGEPYVLRAVIIPPEGPTRLRSPPL